MISLVKWIWGGIKAIGKRLASLFGFLWDMLQSALTWVAAGITYLAHLICDWIADKLSGVFHSLDSVSVDPSSQVLDNIPPLAQYVLHDWLAMDSAIEFLVVFFAIWVSFKVARLGMVPLRAILDVV